MLNGRVVTSMVLMSTMVRNMSSFFIIKQLLTYISVDMKCD